MSGLGAQTPLLSRFGSTSTRVWVEVAIVQQLRLESDEVHQLIAEDCQQSRTWLDR